MGSKKKRKSQKSKHTPREATVKLSTQAEASAIAGETNAVVGTINAGAPIAEKINLPSVESLNAQTKNTEANTGKYAFLVGAGILLSRIIGLARQRAYAHYFGQGAVFDAFSAAFRIPNFLQNIFGEGALSASFIPVYAKLLVKDEEEARRVAGAVFSILALVTSLLVLVGVFSTPLLVKAVAYGFDQERYDMTVRFVKIFFPGTGLLVMSAWCLGVLNSHRRFFLSYSAPIIWNVAIIAALIFFGTRQAKNDFPLAEAAAWGSVVGSALQFGVQLPTVLRLLKRLHLSLDVFNVHVKTVIRNFLPVFFSRGIIQISAFVDSEIASFLPKSAVGAITNAQSLYTLPISLFGMSISAAELPEMSSATGSTEEVAAQLRRRLDKGLQRISFYIVPSAMGFLAFGGVMAATLYQTGKFTSDDAIYVWGILAGSSVGLLASTLGRLYSSTFYALHDTRTPLRFAVLRIVLSTILGFLCATQLPKLLGFNPKWGAAGLTAASGLAGWVEFGLLRRALNKRIGRTGLAFDYVARLWTSALVGAGLGWLIKIFIGARHPIIVGALVLVPFGLTYFAVAAAFGVAEGRTILARAGKIFRRFTGSRGITG